MNGVNDVAASFNRPSSVKSASSLKANGSTLKHLVMFIGWVFSSSSSFFQVVFALYRHDNRAWN